MNRFGIALVTAMLALGFASCGGGGGSDNQRTDAGDGGSDGLISGLSQRPTNSACVAFDLTGTEATTSARAFGALNFGDVITGIYQPPGDDTRWYVTVKSGLLATFANNDAASSYTAITGTPAVNTELEGGLFAMAFHPLFATNRQVFLSYTATTSEHDMVSRITRYTLTTDNRLTDAAHLIELVQPAPNHNGGNIAFGPDGYLYIGFGDGGGAEDEFDNGQNPLTFHSKILRIDVDNGSPYSVPADNPFVGNNAYLPEIFAQGFRNPWKWSFDRVTGNLIAADVGQYDYEEVDIVAAGNNYGWPITEGTHCFNASSCDKTGLTDPVFDYDHSSGCSITGGFVYRGTDVPSMYGKFLYGDYCSSGINAFSIDNPQQTATQIASEPGGITAFGEGNDGEILIGDGGGNLYRIVTTDTTSAFTIPQNLSDHPCFASAAAQQFSTGVIPYSINSTLWSDAADKTRYIAIPDNASLVVDADGDMIFPVGSVLIKQFEHNGQLVETRFLMHHSSGWAGYSYEWNNEGTDASLSTTAHTRVVDDAYTHIFPSSAQCFQCHTDAASIALGPETAQLNRNHTYASTGIAANELDTWQHIGLFSTELSATNRSRYMPAIDDTTASIDARARAYLHSNCSGCHRAGGFPDHFDLSYKLTLAETGICNADPAAGTLGISGAKLLMPGDTATSLIYQRMARRDSNQMPPLATNVTDDVALALIGQWIESIAACP